MSSKLAVMLVHGVEISNPDFAVKAIGLLRRSFSAAAGVDADEALVIRTAFWAPVSQPYEDRLLRRLGGERGQWFYDWLQRSSTRVDAGSLGALVGAGLSGLLRVLPGGPDLHYPTLRWLLIQYLGDAIAYQTSPGDSRLYDEVHAVLARTLRGLATDAGPDAPLCVLGHSMGTIISSNYFYDLQAAGGVYPSGPTAELPAPVRAEMGDSALERAETLSLLYTLGSPLAMWTLRYSDAELDRPVVVPDPRLPAHHPGVRGGWTNVYDPDDVFASELRTLGPGYTCAVTDDRRSVGPRPLGWTPAAHLGYWNNAALMTAIGTELATLWQQAAS